MRYLIALLVVLAACSVPPPSGQVVALEPGVVQFTELAPTELGIPVRVDVRGDAVWPRVWVDGTPHVLRGEQLGERFLAGMGSSVILMQPGEHVIEVYSCDNSWTGWRCACDSGSCSNTMRSVIHVGK